MEHWFWTGIIINACVKIQEGSEQCLSQHYLDQTGKKHVAAMNSALTHPNVSSSSKTGIKKKKKAHFTSGFSFVGNKYYS